MTSSTILKGSLAGIISGILMGFFLKLAENATGQKVYILLLNVDFIPVIGKIQWPELIEFIFHLLVSLVLGLVFYHLTQTWKLRYWKRLGLAAALTLPALFLYFPLSVLARKEVPAVDNWEAFLYWSLAHILFAFFLNHLYPVLEKWKI